MRVSSNQVLSTGVNSMMKHASDTMRYQQQISTGNRFSRASQDATAMSRGVEIQFDKSRYDMLKKNQDFISSRMALADTQLGSVHDVLSSMQEMAVRARGPALGKPGLTAIAQQARQAYEHLADLSVAMDTNDERYLLRTTTEARLSVPKTVITELGGEPSAGTHSATISDEAVFRRRGEYVLTAVPPGEDPGSVYEMRLQIDGKGPDGTAESYYVGQIAPNGPPYTLTFPQELNGRFTHIETNLNGNPVDQYTYPRQPDAFLNLDITLDALPVEDTRIAFTPEPVTVQLDPETRLHSSGDYSVRLTRDSEGVNSAELWFGAQLVRTIEVDGNDIGETGASNRLTLNFGTNEGSPAYFYDFKVTMIGDPTQLAWGDPAEPQGTVPETWVIPEINPADSIAFSVTDSVKQIEIEPGVWVPEGISFREAFGNALSFSDQRSENVLQTARLLVESLERSAEAGTLEDGFVDRQSSLTRATDQIMQYRMRAGAIDAQNDLAKAALETKVTELEAHKGRLLDTDVAEASAGLVRAQSLLEAARSIFSRLESSNLFNRLG